MFTYRFGSGLLGLVSLPEGTRESSSLSIESFGSVSAVSSVVGDTAELVLSLKRIY